MLTAPPHACPVSHQPSGCMHTCVFAHLIVLAAPAHGTCCRLLTVASAHRAGTLESPKWTGPLAKSYPFTLDPFQQVSIACLVR